MCLGQQQPTVTQVPASVQELNMDPNKIQYPSWMTPLFSELFGQVGSALQQAGPYLGGGWSMFPQATTGQAAPSGQWGQFPREATTSNTTWPNLVGQSEAAAAGQGWQLNPAYSDIAALIPGANQANADFASLLAGMNAPKGVK